MVCWVLGLVVADKGEDRRGFFISFLGTTSARRSERMLRVGRGSRSHANRQETAPPVFAPHRVDPALLSILIAAPTLLPVLSARPHVENHVGPGHLPYLRMRAGRRGCVCWP
jgi:hypothetical protein